MGKRTARPGRAKPRKQVSPLTPRKVAQLRCYNEPLPGDMRRRAGIEELRRALNDRFGAAGGREDVSHA